MKLNSIQSKIGGTLIVVLLLTLGLSFSLTALQSSNLLEEQQEQALEAAHQAYLGQARSVFASLQIGTTGSLERGEMEIFDELLVGLGAVPGVIEVGLIGPKGKVLYSNNKENVGLRQPDLSLTGSQAISVEQETDGKVFMAQGHTYEQRCLECHEDVELGSLAGVLFVDYSLEKLQQEQTRQHQALVKASSSSLRNNLLMALGSLILSCLALLLMLRKLIVLPLSRIKMVIQEIGRGHLDQRLKLPQQDELGDAARALDDLSDSLETEVVTPLQQLARGDLTFQVTPRDSGDRLRQAIKQLGEDLGRMVTDIKVAGTQINAGSAQVSESAQSLSHGATQSAASLQQISSSMNVIGRQTSQSAENANQANLLSSEASQAAEIGNQHMGAMVEAMSEINAAGQNISKIIKVIDEIAFQTNLLALNAAVEAARAGQYGKGFAVVAEEVRNLAARSAKAAQETTELIESSVEKTTNGTEIAEKTSAALEKIVNSISKVTDLIGEIATASNDQAQGIGQINIGLQQIDQVIQQNTAGAEESAATSEQLTSQADQLQQLLDRFTLRNAGLATEPPAGHLGMPAQHPANGWRGTPTQKDSSRGKLVIEWNDQLNTGINVIDKQHRRLVELINQLFQCMKEGGNRKLLGDIIDQLVDYTVTHFRTEEELMQRSHYPDLANHKAIHQGFVAKVEDALTKLKNGERVAPADLYKFLKGWLINHIEQQDRDGFAPHVKQAG